MFYLTSTVKFTSCAILILASLFTINAADGDIDLSFGERGIVLSEIAVISAFYDVVVQPDRKIVAVGFAVAGADPRGIVVRYNADGSFDQTFGSGGKVFPVAEALRSVVLLPDGKIIVAGSKLASVMGQPLRNDFLVGRLNQDGTEDTSFNGTGFKSVHLADLDYGQSVKLQSDGRIVLGGYTGTSSSGGQYDYAILRFNVDGSLDTTLGENGWVVTSVPSSNRSWTKFGRLTIQTDDKILATGRADRGIGATVRYNLNGSLDTSFGTGGFVTQAVDSDRVANSIATQPDGKILVGGGTHLFRYNADGSIDPGFGTHAGYSRLPRDITDLKLQNDGKVVVSSNAGIARFHANGSPEFPFRALVFPSTVCCGFGATSNAVAFQPDGKIVIAGLIPETFQRQFSLLARFGGVRTVLDFDGDAKSDLSIFRNGTWYIGPSSNANSFYGIQWGFATDRLTPADYDGDGKTDIAVWRENASGSQAAFFILLSATNTFRVVQLGATGDDPRIVGDWDGDSIADPAIYRSASAVFYHLPSSQSSAIPVAWQWGEGGANEPVRGDFDGDGRMDPAVYNPSIGRWYILKSSDTALRIEQWGLNSDKRVSGDFDGDGITDLAIYRDGLWAILQSSTNQPRYEYWGLATDLPVPGDYDGDGRTDFAVWRDGIYYIIQNANSQPMYWYFGQPGDIPVASVFVR